MRITSEPKTEKIKLRLTEELKNHAQKCADIKNITLSEYIRELIRQDIANT